MSTIRDEEILALIADKSFQERDIGDTERALQAPTPLELIEWLGQSIWEDKGKYTALALAYVDARFMQNRLDEVCGIFNWQSDVRSEAGLIILGISIRDPKTGEWITKWDTGQDKARELMDDSGFGGGRGTFSQSFKRACYQWGIGRDLYSLPKPRCRCNAKRSKKTNKLNFNGWIDHPDEKMAESEETGRPHKSKVDDPTDHLPAKATTFYAIAYNKMKIDRDSARQALSPFIDKGTGEIDYAKAITSLEKNLPPEERLFTIQEKKREEREKDAQSNSNQE